MRVDRIRPEGTITRGTTHPNRLRRVDRWLVQTHRRVLTGGPPPVLVDLGFGADGVTAAEWHQRVSAVRPDAEVVGLEIDRQRVAHAQRWARPGLRFAHGGFEVPLPRGHARVIRALNVLRQYPEEEVPGVWSMLRGRLGGGGVLIEGTCDELGRLGSWVALGADGPSTLTLSWRLRDLAGGLDTAPPSRVAERLPKALIHRNVEGEPIHRLLDDLDDAWRRAAVYANYGVRQRFCAAIDSLAGRYPVVGGRSRWRMGEVTVAWEAVAPRQGPLRGAT